MVHFSGIPELPFKRHMLEDHVVASLLARGRLSRGELEGYGSSKELPAAMGSRVEELDKDVLVEAFEGILELLRFLAAPPAPLRLRSAPGYGAPAALLL